MAFCFYSKGVDTINKSVSVQVKVVPVVVVSPLSVSATEGMTYRFAVCHRKSNKESNSNVFYNRLKQDSEFEIEYRHRRYNF